MLRRPRPGLVEVRHGLLRDPAPDRVMSCDDRDREAGLIYKTLGRMF
jgi:hypothetical protein